MKKILVFICILSSLEISGSYIMIHMDNTQKNHLKSYGIAYLALENNVEVDWLLNYKGGSFMIKYSNSRAIRFNKMLVRGFAIKFIFYGVFIITIFTVYSFNPVPFMCSFTVSFIGLHMMEAIVLKKIQDR